VQAFISEGEPYSAEYGIVKQKNVLIINFVILNIASMLMYINTHGSELRGQESKYSKIKTCTTTTGSLT